MTGAVAVGFLEVDEDVLEADEVLEVDEVLEANDEDLEVEEELDDGRDPTQ